MKVHILSIEEKLDLTNEKLDELLVLSRPPSRGAGTEDEDEYEEEEEEEDEECKGCNCPNCPFPSSDAKDDDKPITVEVKTVKCSPGSDQSDQSD